MGRILAMSSRKFIALLKRQGCTFVRQRSTSHAIYERIVGETTYRAPVVMGKKELSPEYVKLVLKQLGFTDEEIRQLF